MSLEMNAPAATVPCTETRPLIVCGRSASVWPPPSCPRPLTTTLVIPVTSPVIVSVSDAPAFGVKSALRVTIPPPSKLPETVRASAVSVSFPTLRVPVTRSAPVERTCAASPNLTVEPAPTPTVSHPVTLTPASAPDTLPNVRASAPAPPSISVTFENVPPTNSNVSDPAPRLTFPAISAPVFTVTEVSPAEPMIALLAAAPTEAPLPSRTVTLLPAEASVRIAATPVPVPPVTVPDTAIAVAPLPS